jgi:asparagine synthase (glutamine-hydrolysing)
LRGYTQNQLLRDIDTVCMSHALEVRVPFLDPVVADLAFSLPDSTKLGDVTRIRNLAEATYAETGAKKILIDAGRDLLPQGMGLQQKRGFGMPFDEWLRGPLRDVMEDTLSPDTIRQRGFFDPDAVRGIHDRHLSKEGNWLRPWLLMVTELWCRNVLDNSGTDETGENK